MFLVGSVARSLLDNVDRDISKLLHTKIMPTSQPPNIDSTKEDNLLKISPPTSVFSSQNLDWDGVHWEYYRLSLNSIPENHFKQHLILIQPQIP